MSVVVSAYKSILRKVRLGVRALNKFLQSGLDGGLTEQLAEKFDLLPQIAVRDRLDEFFGSSRRIAIELAHLCRGCPRHAQCFAFTHDLAHQPDLLRFIRV